ncbi:hypothetical protein TNIN_436891, partial [Trichonephila inaurata madagascariensis]
MLMFFKKIENVKVPAPFYLCSQFGKFDPGCEVKETEW